MKSEILLRKSIRNWTLLFITALILSGGTAFGLESELAWLDDYFFKYNNSFSFWIHKVYNALRDTNVKYPFLAYGYDWLAFAHLVIAVAFIGVLQDPVRNKWVVQFGRIACIMVFPLAFTAGMIRGIPVFWRLIDCSFGLIGLIPLTICYRKIQKLESL
ncbi:MAG TPA: hypothetical protein VII28_13230 [Puia sp.]